MIQLDVADSDPVVFLSYVALALEAVADVDPQVRTALTLAVPPVRERVIPLLEEALAEAPPLVLVLDDAHLLRGDKVWGLVATLLRSLPAGAQLAIGSRSDPALPLARMRAAGELAEFHASQLSLGEAEVAQLLSLHGCEADAETAAALLAATEGWATGLQLALVAAGAGRPAVEWVGEIRGGRREIAEYLTSEVLDAQPADVQEFLLRTSVLLELTPRLCALVTGRGDGGERLALVARDQLFVVPLGDDGCQYRYHHLFAEMLQVELEKRHPGLPDALHRKLADWYAEEGLPDQAVHHLLAAGEAEAAGELVAAAWPGMWSRGKIETVRRWLASFSDRQVLTQPALTLTAGWVYSALDAGRAGERWCEAACSAPMDDSRRLQTARRHCARRGRCSAPPSEPAASSRCARTRSSRPGSRARRVPAGTRTRRSHSAWRAGSRAPPSARCIRSRSAPARARLGHLSGQRRVGEQRHDDGGGQPEQRGNVRHLPRGRRRGRRLRSGGTERRGWDLHFWWRDGDLHGRGAAVRQYKQRGGDSAGRGKYRRERGGDGGTAGLSEHLGGEGGGIRIWGSGTVAGLEVLASNTAALTGGGVFILGMGTVSNAAGFSVLANESTGGSGGGIFIGGPGTVVGCTTVWSNRAGGGWGSGGGISLGWGGLVQGLSASFISNSAAGGSGGGICIEGAPGTVLDCATFLGNTAATRGGGICIDGDGTISNAGGEIRGNTALGDAGGGVYIGGYGTIDRITIVSNTAWEGGGGIWMKLGSVSNCVIAHNTSSNSWGGGVCFDGDGGLVNCLVTDNEAYGDGGGVYAGWLGNVANCTIINNTAGMSGTDGGGGGLAFDQGFVDNSIVRFNTAISNSSYQGNCWFSFSDVVPVGPGFGNITDDPGFVDMANGDFHLGFNSPCLNSGTNQPWMVGATDLDGGPRIINVVDMGAYEEDISFRIISEHGFISPAGVPALYAGIVLTNAVLSPQIVDPTQYICTGWSMTGNEPLIGSTNYFVMTLTNSAVLTWSWSTNKLTGITAVDPSSTNLNVSVRAEDGSTYQILASDGCITNAPYVLGTTNATGDFVYVDSGLLNSGVSNRYYRLGEDMGNGTVVTSATIYAAYVHVRQTGAWYKLSIPIDFGGSNALDSLKGNQLKRGLSGNNVTGDLLYVMDATGAWTTCLLDSLDRWTDGGGNPLSDSIASWEGFWIKRRSSGVNTNAVYTGRILTESEPVTFRSNDWQLIAWPFAMPRREGDGTNYGWGFAAAGAYRAASWMNADQLIQAESGQGKLLYLNTDGRWYLVGTNTPASNAVLKVGEAYYYNHRGTGFTWRAEEP